MFIRWRRDCNILKTLEKFVLPANENFTTIFKKYVYESWRWVFEAIILKKGNYFCSDLHYVHKIQTGQRHTEKHSNNLFHPQLKFYKILQRFSKNVYEWRRNLFLSFVLNGAKHLTLNYIVSIKWRRESALSCKKTLEKIVWPANENFTTIFKKHV